jgi:hypothetical protein
MDTFSEQQENNGSVEITTGRLWSHALKEVSFTASDPDRPDNRSTLILEDNGATLAGNNVGVCSKSGVNLTKGAKVLYANWVGAKGAKDVYDELSAELGEKVEAVFQDEEYLRPYEPLSRAHIKFTYRTSVECGTIRGVDAGMDEYKVYQPFWAFWAGTVEGRKVLGAPTESWEVDKDKEYREVNETIAWPGRETAERPGAYVRLRDESNVDSKTGLPKRRKELVNKPGKLIDASFFDYEVMKEV